VTSQVLLILNNREEGLGYLKRVKFSIGQEEKDIAEFTSAYKKANMNAKFPPFVQVFFAIYSTVLCSLLDRFP
jgi:hypothetical protein